MNNIKVTPKLTTEERLREILARPRNPHAQIRLARSINQPKKLVGDKY